MKKWLELILFTFFPFLALSAQESKSILPEKKIEEGKIVYLTAATIYEGDTIPYVKLPTVYIFKPIKFKNKRQMMQYARLVRDVKRVYPISKEIRGVIIETYEYLQTLPNEKAREKHIKAVEKGLKQQYTPKLKKLTFTQGKLLIKLVDRECNQTSYQLIKAFMGSFKAVTYNTFASIFGASLKKEYDPSGDDKMVERVILLVESGEI